MKRLLLLSALFLYTFMAPAQIANVIECEGYIEIHLDNHGESISYMFVHGREKLAGHNRNYVVTITGDRLLKIYNAYGNFSGYTITLPVDMRFVEVCHHAVVAVKLQTNERRFYPFKSNKRPALI